MFRYDINESYEKIMKYDRIDRFSIKILWWHLYALIALIISNHFFRLAAYMPSPFAWRLISVVEAAAAFLVGVFLVLATLLIKKRVKSHYYWRIVLTIALTSFSYLFIFISGGSIEMHFHFYIVMAYISIYSDWRLEWIVVLVTLLVHLTLDAAAPGWLFVYGHIPLAPLAHGIPLFTIAVFTAYLCKNHRDVLVTQRELEQKKDEFIGIASHELKTPVTTIKGFTQIFQKYLANSNGDKKFIQYLGKMNEQLDRLTKLINDLLNVSKIRSGKLELHLETFDIDQFVKDIVEEVQGTSLHHTITIKGKAKTSVRADKYRLSQVLTNLLSNAVKYAPASKRLTVNVFSENGNVIVGVEDYGPGIPADKRLSIFQPFYQLENTNRASFSGMGLGLYISAEIMRIHGGDVWVESVVGKGSTFYINIPVIPTK